MRTWTYSWASSDGLRHEGEMIAESKDEVYAALRAKGIHAIRVTERIVPVVRGGLRGLRKRDISWIVGVALAVGAVVVGVALRVGQEKAERTMAERTANRATEPMRHFVELPEGVDLTCVFAHSCDAYLAQYALPGEVLVAEGVGDLRRSKALQDDLMRHVGVPVAIARDDAPVIRELKQIVDGMKREAQKYLSQSNGVENLALFLEERRAMEVTYRKQIRANVQSGLLSRKEADDIFRAMGMKPCP